MLLWVDHRTLIACHCLLALVLAGVLVGIRRTHRDLVGVGSMALGFLLGVPATAIVAVDGIASSAIGGVAINGLLLLCYVLIYRGILRFCEAQFPPRREDRLHGRIVERMAHGSLEPVLWISSFLSTACFLYFTWGSDRVALRVATIALTITVVRILMAVTLLRYAAGRLHMVLFGVSLLAFACLTLFFAVAVFLHGTSSDLMKPDTLASVTLLVGFLFLCVNGAFYVTMIGAAINRKIELQAHLDYLTGTMNRGGIEKALAMEIARTRRSHRPFALLLLDLDRFKQINDVHGHAAGDEALRTAARAIGSVLRIYDKLSRYGGDEFLILLPETSGDDAMLTAGRIRSALATALEPGSTSPPPPPAFTLSIGITHCSSYEEAIDILARADSALYQAKRSGRDCIRLHLPEPTVIGIPEAKPRLSA